MIEIGVKCVTSLCNQTPQYYCCDPKLPTCRGCAEKTCSQCNKRRNVKYVCTQKPLKKLQLNASNTSLPSKCFSCKQNIKGQSLSFQCSHLLCTKCVCQKVCVLIKQNRWVRFVPKEDQILICSCIYRSQASISHILDKYCFCCSEAFGDKKVITLSNGLLFRNTCKNKVKYQSQILQEKLSQTLTKEEIERLIQKDKGVEKQQSIEFSKQDTTETEEEQSCSENKGFSKKKQVKEELKRSSPIQSKQENKVNQKKESNQQKPITKDSFKEKYILVQTCISCNKKFEGKSFSEELPLCKACHNRTRFEFQNFDKKKSDENSGQYLERSSSNPKNQKKFKRTNHSPNLKKLQSNEPKQSRVFKKKVYDDSQICIGCGRKVFIPAVNTISLELGTSLCNQCLKSQNIRMGQASQNPYLIYLKKQRDCQLFGLNLKNQYSCIATKKSEKQRVIKPSIIQCQPDPVNIELFLDVGEEISCFKCGIFLDKKQLLTNELGLLCLDCSIRTMALKKNQKSK